MYSEKSQAVGLAQRPKKSGIEAEREIFDRILNAVIERRLKPGTKLTEESLGELFGVTRARVRKVLLLLSEHDVVQLHRNRGAFIASPSFHETQAVFEARKVIEGWIVRVVAGLQGERRFTAIERLKMHLDAEGQAREDRDHGRIIRLSGEFHTLLGELAGNTILTEILEGLVRRTSLALATNAERDATDCSLDEHFLIVDAIRGGDRARAMMLALRHLDHIMSSTLGRDVR
jgi:DNA-binding GntR family transcriptional regulator